MSNQTSRGNENGGGTHTDLDTVVLHIELTLISIIQGVALTFLVERSYEVLADVALSFLAVCRLRPADRLDLLVPRAGPHIDRDPLAVRIDAQLHVYRVQPC